MRFMSFVLSALFIYATPLALAATESSNGSFEESFKSFGKKLDEAKAKGVEVGEDAKKEWHELQTKTEKATKQAANDTKEKSADWTDRLKGAVGEFNSGLHNAWVKLKGDK